jgi:hypothetical protein
MASGKNLDLMESVKKNRYCKFVPISARKVALSQFSMHLPLNRIHAISELRFDRYGRFAVETNSFHYCISQRREGILNPDWEVWRELELCASLTYI